MFLPTMLIDNSEKSLQTHDLKIKINNLNKIIKSLYKSEKKAK